MVVFIGVCVGGFCSICSRGGVGYMVVLVIGVIVDYFILFWSKIGVFVKLFIFGISWLVRVVGVGFSVWLVCCIC